MRNEKRNNNDVCNKSSKRHQASIKLFNGSSPAPSGTSSDESSGGLASTDSVYAKQPSAFDDLLMTLGCNKGYSAALYTRDQEGTSDSEEDRGKGDHGFGPSDLSDEDDISEGSASNSTGIHANESSLKKCQNSSIAKENEANSEDVLECSDSEDENVSKNAEATASNESQNRSSFSAHLEHTISEVDISNLNEGAIKYVWEIPGFDSAVFKWKGTREFLSKMAGSDQNYGLKLKLYMHWLDLYKKFGGSNFHSSKQREFFSLCNSYRDVLHCDKKAFYHNGSEEDSNFMDAYIMHALNHIYRTRTLVTKNDAKLAKNKGYNEEELLHGGSFLDRGFTRPKVLFLLPFRSIALRIIKRLLQLTPSVHKTNVERLDRFYREFGSEDDKEENVMDTFPTNGDYDENVKPKSTKPVDYQVLFGGNISEEFMIGIKFTRKSIKLYSDFHSSDIIVASPVQLIQAIGRADVEKDKDVDYLSSIEVVIIDHADIIAMQNWSHVYSIFEQLNQIPSDPHGTDIMRVRPWYLDGHARFYRQTILSGSFLTPDMNALFNNLCFNYEGKVKFTSVHNGVLHKVLLPVRQVFERFETSSIADADDARFDYFVKKVFPKINDSIQGGVMLFISHYFEFVRIRNFLKSQNSSFCLLGEYTKQADISRARVWFFQGKRKIMLYTERAHFYHRYKIRGIQNLIVYSLPERRDFYSEIMNMLDGANNMSCSVLFSGFDKLRLERIVGSTASKKMLSSEKSIFVFC